MCWSAAQLVSNIRAPLKCSNCHGTCVEIGCFQRQSSQETCSAPWLNELQGFYITSGALLGRARSSAIPSSTAGSDGNCHGALNTCSDGRCRLRRKHYGSIATSSFN
mmetsp:Transcript_99667/g.277573  ORF Transcript_99667/g.277573 Transcript_99667/m.277573 type:complete len:107 (+) Transcript_99667:42-362(+)